MPMLNIRTDEKIKSILQEIAKLKGVSLSSLVLLAIDKMIENEFDYQLVNIVDKYRKPDEPVFDIKELYQEFGL